MRKIIGYGLRVLHLIWINLMFFLSISLSNENMLYLIIFWLTMIGINLKYRGCPLTRLECRLVGDKWTVVDPLLQLLHIVVTNQRRYQITVLSGIINLGVSIVRYCL